METRIDLGNVPVKVKQHHHRGGSGWRFVEYYTDEVSVDLADCPPKELMAEAANLQKIILARKATKYTDVDNWHSLYIIGPVSGYPVKIGIADDPITRMSVLQTGNHERLVFHAVLWMDDAAFVEQDVLDAATSIGIREHGEWLVATPATALDMILEAVQARGSTVLTSAMAVENIGRRMLALDQAKRHMKREMAGG